MNKQLYRLVFSKHLGMFVPAPEIASSHAGKSSCSLARSRRRALLSLLAAAFVPTSLALADQPAGLVPHATQLWSNAAIDAARTSANQMTIKQTAAKAILNWQQLNLNKGQTLTFDQAGNRNWAALNRIYDVNPSVISGNVNASGHLYFVNSNGIIFGNGAQINVGSLTATSLNVTDALFNAGILSNPAAAAFSGTSGFVHVDAGASLTAASGGRVMLLAPDVTNSGVINTPQGQTILAAGKKVYLTDSTDPAGLLVEVDSGGTATNLGDIVSRLGNVTMVGLAVNQQGRISASTSVRANGSIKLMARDTVTVTSATTTTDGVAKTTYTQATSRGGVVTLGKNSVTQVAVETDDKEEVLRSQLTDASGNKVLGVSRVEMSGGVINIDGKIVAHGGDVSATAAFNPSNTNESATPGSAVQATRVYMGRNALIDVSGVDARAPMSRNQLGIQLYSEQLKDTPLLRGTELLGKTIYVDVRNGTKLIADDALAAAKALKGITIAEAMSNGGTVKLEAKLGDVVLDAGSRVDVSGGSVAYDAGYVRESQLTYKGKTVSIADANKTTPYDGLADIYSVTSKKWGVTRSWTLASNKGKYYQGYTEGSDAGAVNVVAQNAILQGDFTALTRPGDTQRDPSHDILPVGGTFNFTLNTTGMTGVAPTFRVVANNPDTLADTFSVVGDFDVNTGKFAQGSVLPSTEILLSNVLFSRGFNNFSVNAGGGTISVDAAIKTAPKGSVSLATAGQVVVNADIVAPSGAITIVGGDTTVSDRVRISASGLYTNDTPGVSGALKSGVFVDGGSVSIAEKDTDKGGLTLGNGVAIEANAGAWLKSDGKLSGGNGGSVTLYGVSNLEGADVSAFGFSKGGSLSLSAIGNIQAGGRNPAANETLWLPEVFFTQGGFAGYTLETSQHQSSLLIGDLAGSVTEIHPTTQTFVANGGFGTLVSGTDMTKVASPVLLADVLRTPASVTFKSAGSLTVAEKATIRTDAPATGAGGAINLQSFGQMDVMGKLVAPAGSISAAITGGITEVYDNTLSLFVGPNAELSAKGHYAVKPSGNGLLNANVLNAGSISLDGGDRAVVVVKEGSVLDVSGTSGQADIASATGYRRQTLYGAAGSINVAARDGMVLDGDMRAAAAGTGAGSSLTMTLKGGDDSTGDHPNGARVFTVTQDKHLLAANLHAGDSVSAVTGGGAISAEQVGAAGFDNVNLNVDRGVVGDKVLLADGVNLRVKNSLALKSSLLEAAGSGTATLAADYVALGGDSTATAAAGNAALQVNAKWMDLVGDLAVSGVRKTTLAADLDIRARGTKATIEGSLVAPGEMVLSARQLYPVTNGAFRFETTGGGNSIEVKSSGAAATTVPLSAAGKLTLTADNIIQGGVIRAPLGQITLNAANNLTLKPGSLTSVSAEGQLIPYGLTRLGGMDLLAPTTDLVASDSGTVLTAMPDKKVVLKASQVDMKAGAKVDISGGGDTLAYEWINGIGGSSDILGKTGVYAVIPGVQGEYAPFDYNYTQPGLGIKAGDAVHLTNVPGLADGNYTLLPARYALLPGAFMVQVSDVSLASGRSVSQVDGSTLVSGYRVNGSARDTLDSVFKVTSGSIFHTAKGEVSHSPSEYRLTTGNKFFAGLAADTGTNVPRLATDAGQLAINASAGLVLDADVLANKQAGARGAMVDIVSDKIKVVSSLGAPDGNILQLTASSLNDLNAESLLLGGVRSQGGYNITTGASSVTFANDAEHALQGPELIAVASDTLTVNAGAKINTLASSGTAGTASLHASGDGALLAVSSLNNLEFDRSGVANVKGTLNVADGAQVTAHRSMVLDSTASASLEGSLGVADGGTITLGANRVLLGEANVATTGLHVSDTLLGSFGKLSSVTLNSYKNIDVYGPVNLGNSSLDLTLNAGGIAGHLSNNQVATLTARNFVLKNSLGATYESSTAATGSVLNVSADNITLAGGATNTTTETGGFDQVNLSAGKEVSFSGTGTDTVHASQTTITSSRITAATGADYKLTSTGKLTTALAANPATMAAAKGLGARLEMTGTELALGGKVELPSGQLTAHATTGNVVVDSTAQLKAMSVPVAFDKYTAYTPGGTVNLQADAGNVVIGAGSRVDVSGNGNANAGTVKISAVSGTATVDGTLAGSAGNDGGKGGSFVLDVKNLANANAVNEKLNAGGFDESRQFRVRNGNVTISGTGNQAMKSHEVIVADDAGTLTVSGEIDASSGKNGSIGLYAKNGVTLTGAANLNAASTKAGVDGGVVEIATTNGSLELQTGSVIDVSAGAGGKGGEVHLRAPRNAANTDLNVTAANSTFTGASAVRAEGFKTYTKSTNSIVTADTGVTGAATTWYKQAESFMKSALVNSGVGLHRLGKVNDPVFSIVPGIEVDSTAGSNVDLALTNDWTLHNWRFDPVTGVGTTTASSGLNSSGKPLLAGILTLRASGNLKLNAILSDGFSSSTMTMNNSAQGVDAWSYNLVGGADFTAANVMATKQAAGGVFLPTTGNSTTTKGVRTGSGDIRIAAGGDLNMGNEYSVIYTAGRKADAWGGFAQSTNYLTDGGDIEIDVMGNVVGKIGATGAQQLISPWLFRQGGGSTSKNVSWWVRPDLFKQGVGALGGGDVSVHAGGSVTNLSVSVPTTARYDSSGNVSLNGGGDVQVAAGGDITSGVYFAGKGNVNLTSGGEIKAASNTFGTAIALQDASAKVSAVKSAFVETVFNPTMWSQVTTNASSLDTTGNNAYFLTYGRDSAFKLESLTGNATLGSFDVSRITSHLVSGTNNTNLRAALEIHPGMVEAHSFSGDINVGRLVLAPSDTGNLNLMAAGNVAANGPKGLIAVSDADPGLLPSVLNPVSQSGGFVTSVTQFRTSHASSPLHETDHDPVAIVARDGSITLPGYVSTDTSAGPGVTSPKAAYIHAGKDIQLSADVQQLHNNDITVIEAGRDLTMPLDPSSQIKLGGPGELLVQAGRNVSLGTSKGIVTVANTVNPALSGTGAAITVLAGLGGDGADVSGYVANYIAPTGTGPSVLQGDTAQLAAYRSDTSKAVATYMRKLTGNSALSEPDAMTQFLALDKDRQAVFAYRHFSSELLASGKGYATSKNHKRGDTAIAAMFPASRRYNGDLSLYNSQLRTYRDGSIDILTPGGFINAGVPTSSGNDIGIVTEHGGDIRAFAETGFQVEQSKVITQYGSDITVWVNNGDIDAGRGSKTAVSVPKRVVSTDTDGNTTIEVKGVAAGSGIRAQTYDPDGPSGSQEAPKLGSVALIAPRGVLNASEAGIAAGNFLAVATQVLGANNITVSGTSTGVPVADTGSLAGSLTGVSNAASDATKSVSNDVARQAAQSASNAFSTKTVMPSFISVEVIGLGD